MSRSFATTSDSLTSVNNVTALSTPISCAIWGKVTNSTGVGGSGNIWDFNASYGMAVNNSSQISAELPGGGVIGTSSLNTWFHAGWTALLNNTSQTAQYYFNGTNSGSSTANMGGGLNTFQITAGAGPFGGSINGGSLADFAIWTDILTLAEYQALSKGVRPYNIRPTKLLIYWPIDGIQSPEPDFSGKANNATVAGTARSFGPPFLPFTPRWPRLDPVFTPTIIPAQAVAAHFSRKVNVVGY